ncbi:MAG: hypothetical protein K2O24_02760 [Muribaculaceae bacterium]|nr:hypothetical protein [Muribaculaceae bacterium]
MNRITMRLLGCTAVLGSLMMSCGNDNVIIRNEDDNESPVTEKQESELLRRTPELEASVAQQYELGTKILGNVSAAAGRENILFSPFSFHLAASMVANGVAGETADELLAFLGTPDKELLNGTNREMLSSIPYLDRDVTFEIANAIWTDTDLNVKADFKSILVDNYSSDCNTVKYGIDDVTGAINLWVKEHTRGMIDPFLEPSSQVDGPLAVVNALYFKAPWNEPFEKDKSFSASFRTSTGDRNVTYMHTDKVNGRYMCGDAAESLTLYYGNGHYSITFVLPKDGVDIGEWIRTMSAGDVMNFVTNGGWMTGKVTLPKFEVESFMDLDKDLIAMGVSRIFNPSLWSGLTDDMTPLSVGRILQKAKFSVDEAGAEGSSATMIVPIMWNPGQNTDHFEFKVNRPFMFVVTESGCRTPIFMGIVQKP